MSELETGFLISSAHSGAPQSEQQALSISPVATQWLLEICPCAWLGNSKWDKRIDQETSFARPRDTVLAIEADAHELTLTVSPAGAHPAQTSICREVSCQIRRDLPCTTPFFSLLSRCSAGAALGRDGKRANGRSESQRLPNSPLRRCQGFTQKSKPQLLEVSLKAHFLSY